MTACLSVDLSLSLSSFRSLRCQKVGMSGKIEQQLFNIFKNSLSLLDTLTPSLIARFLSLSLLRSLSLSYSLSLSLSLSQDGTVGLACLIGVGIFYVPWPIASSFFNSLFLIAAGHSLSIFKLTFSERERETEELERERGSNFRFWETRSGLATNF